MMQLPKLTITITQYAQVKVVISSRVARERAFLDSGDQQRGGVCIV
jgi:hypothetical protein